MLPRVAVHEGSHCVCGAALGVAVLSATTVPSAEYNGACWLAPPSWGSDADAYLAALFAGGIGEGRLLGQPADGLFSAGDLALIHGISKDPARLERARSVAERVVSWEWDSILSLAASLERAAANGQAIAGIGAALAIERGFRARRLRALQQRAQGVLAWQVRS